MFWNRTYRESATASQPELSNGVDVLTEAMPDPLLGAGFAVLSAVGLTAQSLAVRVGTRDSTVSELIVVMFGINLLVMVPLTAVAEYPRFGLTPAAVGAFAVAGVLGSLLGRSAYFLGIATIGSSRTEPLKALFPVVSVVAAVFVLDETLTSRHLLGIALVLGGGMAVILEARDSAVTGTGRQLLLGMAFPLAAALFLGVDPVFTKLGLAEGTPALVGVTIRVAAGAAGFGAYLAWRRLRGGRGLSITLDRWLGLAALANTVYLLAYYAALARIPVSVATPILGTSTLLVVLAAAVFIPEDERVTAKLVAAAAVVLVGVGLVVRA